MFDFDDPDDEEWATDPEQTAGDLEDEGYSLDDHETETNVDGDLLHYEVYVNDEGDTVRVLVEVEGRRSLLGFEDGDHEEDNLPG